MEKPGFLSYKQTGEALNASPVRHSILKHVRVT